MDITKKLLELWKNSDNLLGWIPECLFILVATIILSTISRKFLKGLSKKARVESNIFLNATYYSLQAPLNVLIWFIGTMFMALVLKRHFNEPAVLDWIDPIRRVGGIVIVAWMVLRFLDRGEENITTPNQYRKAVNRTTALAIGRLIKISLFTIVSLLVMQALGVEIGGIVTLGSAGTIVLGIAARDLLANFFGGLMIFTDRPFSVGDWIRSSEKNIEGDVEHIGWRLTRIRTFDKRPLYVPNSLFLTLTIENPQRMLNRRIREIVGLRYQDASKIPQIVTDIEDMLRANEDIADNRTLFVAFHKFGPSSLELLVYCFTKTTDWITYMKAQQKVFCKLVEIIHKHDADIAFPTTTIDYELNKLNTSVPSEELT